MSKKILVIGLLVLCLAAVMPVASATTTYNVSNFEELKIALTDTTASEIKINLKENITIYSSDVNLLENHSIKSTTSVTINGNNKSVSILSNGEPFLNKDVNNESAIILFMNGTISIKNLVIKDSEILTNGNRFSIFALPAHSNNETHVIIENLNVYNVTGQENGSYYLIRPAVVEDTTLFINNFTFTENRDFGFVLQHEGRTWGDDEKDRIVIKNGLVKNNVGLQPILSLWRSEVDNVTFDNNHGYARLLSNAGAGSYNNLVWHTVSNCSFTNNSVGYQLLLLAYSNTSAMTLENSYFENNTVTGNVTGPNICFISTNGDSVVSHCTFVNNHIDNFENKNNSSYFGQWSGSSPTLILSFNTFVNNSVSGYNESYRRIIIDFGNLFVNNTQMTEASTEHSLWIDSYESVFGSNQPALNGGKTKNIQLTSDDTNSALNKISAADYLAALGSTPSADKDQVGKKRIYGSGVDYGAVELHKNPIMTIIDNILGGSSGGKDESGKTQPSLIKFLFGENSIFSSVGSLFSRIVYGYANADIPLISPAHQFIIDKWGLQP